MTTINIHNLTFGYAGQDDIFTNQNLTLDTDWHLGLTARNGRGKTTLLNLMRSHLDNHGAITMPVPTTYFPQIVTDPTAAVWAVIDQVSSAELWQVERELTLLGLDTAILYRNFATLSGGEQTKVLLAVLFAVDGAFPLIDEPTNHLDQGSRTQVANYLQRKRSGYIVVAHDVDFLDAVTDRTLAIDKSQITVTQGNYSSYRAAKERQDDSERAHQLTLRRDIGRLHQAAQDRRQWSFGTEAEKHGDPHIPGSKVGTKGEIGTRAAKMMKKAKNLERRRDVEINTKETLLKNIEYIDPLTMHYAPDYRKVLITVRDLTLTPLDSTTPLFAPVSFTLHSGEQLAITGPNGAGKSSLIAVLRGVYPGTVSGEITVAPVPTSLTRQIFANTGLLTTFAETHALNYQDLLSNLKKLGLARSVFTTPIEFMSAGQQKKVELAASLAQPAVLYMWDEPLNYLDVFNQDQLATLINQVRPTLILTEHDAHFITSIGAQVIKLQAN